MRSKPTHESYTFAGIITKGDREGYNRFQLNSPQYFRHTLNTKFKPGQHVTITFTSKKPNRSLQQNNFYWLYLTDIAERTGEEVLDLHELFKGKFLSEVKEVMGEQVRVKRSTTGLSIGEFSEYIQNIAELTEIEPPDVKNWELSTTYIQQ